MLQAVLDLVFPPRCLGCARHGQALCEPCRQDLPLLGASSCRRCALPRGPGHGCRGCAGLSASLSALHAMCAYEGAARQAVHALKFRGGRGLAPLLGDLLREHLRRRPLRADLVVPVPLAAGRLRERGYNQSVLLAEQILESVGGTLAVDVLQRFERPPQQTLSAAERRRNLVGAFTATVGVAGQHVLLVDDVATTGSTLSACADALTVAGARRVTALVFARDL